MAGLAMGMVALIDAHVHCWQLGHHACTWPPPGLGAIHRDFGLGDWQAEAAPLGATRAILVQSQASARDTDWLLELARDDSRVAGVVGWIDLAAPGASAGIAQLAASPKLRGVRPMLQDQPDIDWILASALRPAFAALVAWGLCFDALVRPDQLTTLLRLADRHPDLRIVIDHAAKPELACGRLDPWRSLIDGLAALPNVYCKLSGLVTEAGPGWRVAQLAPCVDHLLAAFGASRLLWGSDWPVVNLAGGYARWLAATDELLPRDAASRARILGANAARVYGVDAGMGS
ncbi:MAG TPA: amidohydrolase family protein [Rhodanobacteraceae bacterium]|nr:amidohydrolase family protein [Rhodanobacteraceae bacterium]